MAETGGTNRSKGKTQKTWDHPHKGDARKQQKAGNYPNYFSWKTRSGHVFQLDDSQGKETITIQHRGGTAIQMDHEGGLHITAHNGKYEIVFGEDRMTVSGAQDITVKGDASLRVYGDYNVTCHKDYNLSVLGNFNLAAKNHNRHILGNIDTQARNENKKIMGSSAKIARGGIAYVSKGSVTVASQSDQVHIGGASGVNLATKEGNITQNIEKGNFHSETKDGEYHVKSKGAVNVESTDENMKFKSKKDFGIESEQNGIQVKAQKDIALSAATGDIQADSQAGNVEVKAQSKLDLRATGEASLHGSTTHVSGQTTTHVTGGTSVNVDGPSGLNLNGGLGQLMSALGLQLDFDFGSASGEKGTSRGSQAPDRPAGNEEAINSWNKFA
jgi:hypothetical protein